MTDSSIESNYMEIEYDSKLFNEYLEDVLRIEAVA